MTTRPLPSSVLDAETAPTLARLLEAELDYSLTAANGFISHLAMMLVAATGLGASSAELEALYEGSVKNDGLVPRQRPGWLPEATEEVARRGIGSVVAERMVGLLNAPSSQFFHSVIRLEHAVEAAHCGQVANALQDWAHNAIPLPALTVSNGALPLLDAMRSVPGQAEDLEVGTTSLTTMTAEPRFVAALSRAWLGPGVLDHACQLALAAHLSRNSLATLHFVTGCRAARCVAALLEPPHARRFEAHVGQAIAAGYAAFGPASLPEPAALEQLRGMALPSSPLIARAALEQRDEHVIKLVHACFREHERTGEPLYRYVAARSVGLLEG